MFAVMGLGLKLLGVGKHIKNFVFKYWKWVLLAVLLVVAFFWHQSHVKDMQAQYFENGVNATIKSMKGKVEAANKRNRELETTIKSGLDQYASKQEAKREKQRREEARHEENIRTLVEVVPMWRSQECTVTPSVLEERNAIRALGPKK